MRTGNDIRTVDLDHLARDHGAEEVRRSLDCLRNLVSYASEEATRLDQDRLSRLLSSALLELDTALRKPNELNA